MTSTRELYAFLTFTAMMMVYHCKADFPPPPTGLTFKWLDPFAVNVSWQDPSGLQDSKVMYKIRLKGFEHPFNCRTKKYLKVSSLTEQIGSDPWTYQVWTVVGNCKSTNESNKVDITINSPKTQVKLKDTKCIIYTEGMNCSWNSTHQPFNLSYRTCPEETLKPLRTCDRPYSSAERSGCYLKDDEFKERKVDVCIHVETEAGWSTFKPRFVVPSPKLIIKEEKDDLRLEGEHQSIRNCKWNFTVCYTRCNKPEVCISKVGPSEIRYDKDCLYEFRSRTESRHCDLASDFSDVVKYGSNKPPDQTLMVVAIVVPIILSVCIILSCYCVRKHSSILCPIIPDPSAIFKEMMIHGNKDHKTTGNLYTPVPEPIESCKVTVVAENSDLLYRANLLT
ncbi:interleukin-13 receptor subunit alpha-1-like [Gymnodraco acuticeps]|uniref:Interleukin-13 receptor subunit alpha-1-like n=1 Tax=Gymnodraco acuticeps TaxID=8218 RepID=A0A6P8TQI5_GYMAC|nr:interleukin-13 receptor subunit alpha-1-like [Gymnodraco acuticeps]